MTGRLCACAVSSRDSTPTSVTNNFIVALMHGDDGQSKLEPSTVSEVQSRPKVRPPKTCDCVRRHLAVGPSRPFVYPMRRMTDRQAFSVEIASP